MFGPAAPGGTAAELRADTKRLGRLVSLPGGGILPKLRAYVDGLGSGLGDQVIKAVWHDAAGNRLAVGQEVLITDGQAADWVDLPFASPPGLGAGDYIYAIHAGGADRSARIYGDNLATPVRNWVPNPTLASGLTGWAAAASSGTTVKAAISLITTDGFRGTTNAAEATFTFSAAGQSGGVYINNPSNSPANYRPVAPGDVTYVGIAAKVQAATAAVASLRIRTRYLKADGTYLSEHDLTTLANPVTGTWYWLTGSEPAPPSAAFVSVMVYSFGNGAGDVTLRADAAFVSDVSAGYGDGSMAGWTWDGAAHGSPSRGAQGIANMIGNPLPNGLGAGQGLWGSANATVTAGSEPTSPTGTYLKVANPAGNQDPFSSTPSNAINAFFFSAVPGETWTLSAWVRWNQAAIDGGFASGQTGVPSLWTQGTGGGVKYAAPPQAPVAGQWYRLSVTYTLPATVTSFFMRLYGMRSLAGGEVDYAGITLVQGASDPGLIDGTQPGCDWAGAAHTSASIQWQIPEVGDTYADGAAATTGLTPAGAKLPGTLSVQAIVEDHAEGQASFTFTTSGEGHALDPAGGTVTFRFDTFGEGHTVTPAEAIAEFAMTLTGEGHAELPAAGETEFAFALTGEASEGFAPAPGHIDRPVAGHIERRPIAHRR